MPAFLETGSDPIIRFWSARDADDLRSIVPTCRLALTFEPQKWCLLGLEQDSRDVSFCLHGGFPEHWSQYSLLEQFKWLSKIFRDHLSDVLPEDHPQRPLPLILLASESVCTIPLSVCRGEIPRDSLDLLFGSREHSEDFHLYHIRDTEVVVAARFSRELSLASAALFPNHRLISLEAALIMRFLNPTPADDTQQSFESELLIARLDHRILVAQKNNNNLQACNTFDSGTPEEVLYYALLLDQGQSKRAYMAGFEQAEEELLKPLLLESFGSCISSNWILDEASVSEREPWNLLTQGSMPALAFYILRNPF